MVAEFVETVHDEWSVIPFRLGFARVVPWEDVKRDLGLD